MGDNDDVWKQQFAYKLAHILKEIDPNVFYEEILKHAVFTDKKLIDAIQQIMNSKHEDRIKKITKYYELLSYTSIDTKNMALNFILNLLILHHFITTNQIDNVMKVISNLETNRPQYNEYMRLLLNYYTSYYYLLIGKNAEARILLDNILYSMNHQFHPNLTVYSLKLMFKIYSFLYYKDIFVEFLEVINSLKGRINPSIQSELLILELQLYTFLKKFNVIEQLNKAFALKELHNPMFKGTYLFSQAMKRFYEFKYYQAFEMFNKALEYLMLQHYDSNNLDYNDFMLLIKNYMGITLMNLNRLHEARIIFEEIRDYSLQTQLMFLKIKARVYLSRINEIDIDFDLYMQTSDNGETNSDLMKLLEYNSEHPLSYLLLGIFEFRRDMTFQSVILLEKALMISKKNKFFHEYLLSFRYLLLTGIRIYGGTEFYKHPKVYQFLRSSIESFMECHDERLKLELFMIRLIGILYHQEHHQFDGFFDMFISTYRSVWAKSILTGDYEFIQEFNNQLKAFRDEIQKTKKLILDDYMNLFSLFMKSLDHLGLNPLILTLYTSNFDVIRERHEFFLRAVEKMWGITAVIDNE